MTYENQSLDDLVIFEMMQFCSLQTLANLRLSCKKFLNLSLLINTTPIHVLLSFVHHLYSTQTPRRTDFNNLKYYGIPICSFIFLENSEIHILEPNRSLYVDTFFVDIDPWQSEVPIVYQYFFKDNKYGIVLAGHDKNSTFQTMHTRFKEVVITSNSIKIKSSKLEEFVQNHGYQIVFISGNKYICHKNTKLKFQYDEYDSRGNLTFSLLGYSDYYPFICRYNDSYHSDKWIFLQSPGSRNIFLIQRAQNSQTTQTTQTVQKIQKSQKLPQNYKDGQLKLIRRRTSTPQFCPISLLNDDWLIFYYTVDKQTDIVYLNMNNGEYFSKNITYNHIFKQSIIYGFLLNNGQKFEFSDYSHSIIDIFPFGTDKPKSEENFFGIEPMSTIKILSTTIE